MLDRKIFPELSSATFVCLKAFGDLVVLRQALRTAVRSRSPGPVVVIGSHLVELFRTLGDFGGECVVVESGAEVPALFDVKRRGLRLALQSAWNLRKQVERANIDRDRTLIFDRVGWRESFIAGHLSIAGLPAAANIYIAYRETGIFADRASAAQPRPPPSHPTSVGIFPASRIAGKNFPRQIVAEVIDGCLKTGLRPFLCLLEGERPDLAGLPVSVKRLPRTFSALAAAVRSVDLVVSADSLPAHLAEYFELPVFVVTPIDNPYWLPLTAFEANRWARFDNLSGRSRIHDFLARGA